MRNYLMVFLEQWQVNLFDDLGNPAGSFLTTTNGGDHDELMKNVLESQASTQASLPPLWTATFDSYVGPTKSYLLLDKTTVLRIMKDIPDYFYNAITTQTVPSTQVVRSQIDVSPRKEGWSDQDGAKRSPPPSDKGIKQDFSGAAGLVAFLNSLPALAAKLPAREAGIVMFAYKNGIDGVWSVVQVIDYLSANRII